MVKISRAVFWKAAILTIIVFILGIFTGFLLESSRISEIVETYKQVEIDWADAKMQSSYFQVVDIAKCKTAIEENLRFSDKVYQEGLKLERYEEANKLVKRISLDYEKKRYTLLKMEFWLNSIALKKRCNAKYDNLVYFYVDKPTYIQRSEQNAQAIILKELKRRYAAQVMLIPLPIDLDLSIINIITNTYNITNIPSLLINEEVKLDGVHGLEDIENLINPGINNK